ncbi:MAG: TraM recognition domain-containing protein [Halomonas sp.]|nr:TraM recognition domain-containing protein [Halomonas sp.]
MIKRLGIKDIISGTRPTKEKKLVLGHPDGHEPGALMDIPLSARAAHMHVIGRSRSGKSRFLADLIFQDIVNHTGLCLIDPESELVNRILARLANDSLAQRIQPRIHPVKLGDQDSFLRFNPLHCDDLSDAYTVADKVTEAITRIYGGKDSTETPQFAFVTDVICTILALRGLPLAAGQYFLENTPAIEEVRQQIISGVPNPYYRHQAEQFIQMSGREFRETVGSSLRRLHKILANPYVIRMFSTTENNLPLKQMMDEGHVLLIDAGVEGSKLKRTELDFMGSMLVNNIYAEATKRDPIQNPKPFMLYVDEVQNFVNHDIERILNQAAKRGLYLTLSHQSLQQLASAGEDIYHGVINNTLIKVVFQVGFSDADVLADELFADEIDFARVKEELKVPVTVGHERVKLHGQSDSEGYSYSTGDGSNSGGSISEQINPDTGDVVGSAQTINQGYSSTDSETRSQSTTRSENEALKPVIEWIATQTYNLEEQRYELKRKLSHQPPRHGYIALSRAGTAGFTTRDTPEVPSIPSRELAYIAKLRANSPWISLEKKQPGIEAKANQSLDLKQLQLLVEAKKKAGELLKKEDSTEDYWEEWDS